MTKLLTPDTHSKTVGGSTARRVLSCPASVLLSQNAPEQPSSKYADRGTLLHNVMAKLLADPSIFPEDLIGTTYEGIEFTQEMADEAIIPALEALEEIDPEGQMELRIEERVTYGKYLHKDLPEAFGTADVIGRMDNRLIVLDWKFGQGVPVEVEENAQLLFYAAAMLRTPSLKTFCEGLEVIELVIVQPPSVKRWETTVQYVKVWEKGLKFALKEAYEPDPRIEVGDHCRYCPAKTSGCPKFDKAIERALSIDLSTVDICKMANALKQAELLEQWISDLRGIAHKALESGIQIPGWKLVQKRATRKWADEAKAESAIRLALAGCVSDSMEDDIVLEEPALKSVAQMEKVLKVHKVKLPEDLVIAVSSGTTIAPTEDPRPAVGDMGKLLEEGLNKITTKKEERKVIPSSNAYQALKMAFHAY